VGALRCGAICLCALAAACTDIGDPQGSDVPPFDGAPAGADAAPASDAAAATVTLVFGEADDADVTGVTVDTYLDAANPSLNYGAGVTARIDADPSRVALLRFDISSIAPGATVTAAELAVTTAVDPLEEGSVQIFEVMENWAEGDGVGAAAAANWTQRTSNNDWTTAGAGSGSRAPSAMSEVAPSTAATRYRVALPLELVQRWVADPATNRGLVLVAINAATHGVDLESSESATTAARPSLSITFIP
jgi:hypothetical protein